jgi:glycosyltransferase involved in cell wall biosynthesis
MKRSVLIIAHNEQSHIAECIESILKQTVPADEVILVVHNSTDQTGAIAQQYPITTIMFNGPPGIAQARIRGIAEVGGDIVLCIDGDSYAEKNWIAVMSETLVTRNNILVGSWIKFKRRKMNTIANLFNKYTCVSSYTDPSYWVWGGSFAFWGKNKNLVTELLENSIIFSQALQLSRNPDDYWLAVLIKNIGCIEITNKTHTTHYPKEISPKARRMRNKENRRNGKDIRSFLTKKAL